MRRAPEPKRRSGGAATSARATRNAIPAAAAANPKIVATGSFRPNGFGLYDTAGNAAEWVEDCWNDNYRGAPKDAVAWTTGDCRLRVLRGGNFTSKAIDVRSSARFRYDQDVRYYANGFRIVRDLPQ